MSFFSLTRTSVRSLFLSIAKCIFTWMSIYQSIFIGLSISIFIGISIYLFICFLFTHYLCLLSISWYGEMWYYVTLKGWKWICLDRKYYIDNNGVHRIVGEYTLTLFEDQQNNRKIVCLCDDYGSMTAIYMLACVKARYQRRGVHMSCSCGIRSNLCRSVCRHWVKVANVCLPSNIYECNKGTRDTICRGMCVHGSQSHSYIHGCHAHDGMDIIVHTYQQTQKFQ